MDRITSFCVSAFFFVSFLGYFAFGQDSASDVITVTAINGCLYDDPNANTGERKCTIKDNSKDKCRTLDGYRNPLFRSDPVFTFCCEGCKKAPKLTRKLKKLQVVSFICKCK